MPDEDNNFGGSLENDDVTLTLRMGLEELNYSWSAIEKLAKDR